MSAISGTVSKQRPEVSWWRKRGVREALVAFLFVLPALLNFTLFRYYPIAWAFRTSFWDYSFLGGYRDMVGLNNYIRAFTMDPIFWSSMRTTLTYGIFYIPIQVSLALALALFAVQKKPGVGTLRALIFIPVVTSFVVVSIIWGMILNQDVGLVNSILQTLGFPRQAFLTSRENALPSIIAISIWKNVGYSLIIFVAGLKGIPEMYYEAAIVDGANPWQRFWKITLPLLRRHLMFVTVWATLGAFQVFIPIYTLTNGGPSRATNVIVYYIYRQAFIFSEMGYATALSIILLITILIITMILMRLLRSEE